MIHVDMCNQAIVEVLRKVELTRSQAAKLLEIMSVPTELHDEVISAGITRGLFVSTGHSLRLAEPRGAGAGMANVLQSAA